MVEVAHSPSWLPAIVAAANPPTTAVNPNSTPATRVRAEAFASRMALGPPAISTPAVISTAADSNRTTIRAPRVNSSQDVPINRAAPARTSPPPRYPRTSATRRGAPASTASAARTASACSAVSTPSPTSLTSAASCSAVSVVAMVPPRCVVTRVRHGRTFGGP